MDGITIRQANTADIGAILSVYDSARRFMRANGNFSQWAGGYPAREDVLGDIMSGNGYIGETPDGEIVMAFAFIIGKDPTYSTIMDGAWLNDRPYGTIHRIGTNGRRSGMLKACVDFCSAFTDNLRLDTHADNRPMLEAVNRLGFQRCGIIFCRDGTPRIAFQKVLR